MMKKIKALFYPLMGIILFTGLGGTSFSQEETKKPDQKDFSSIQSERFLDRCNLDMSFGIGGLSIKPLKHFDIGWTNQYPPQVDLQGNFRVKMKSFQGFLKLKLGLDKIGPLKSGDSYVDEKSILFKAGPGISYSRRISEGITFQPFLEGNYLSLSGAKKEKDDVTKKTWPVFDPFSYSDFEPEFGASLLFSQTVDLTYSFRPGERSFHFVSFSHAPFLKNSLTPKVYYELMIGDKVKAFYAGVRWPAALSGVDKAKDYSLSKRLLEKKGFLSELFYYTYMGEVLTYTLASFLGLVVMGSTGL
jgi:hypothetical protein